MLPNKPNVASSASNKRPNSSSNNYSNPTFKRTKLHNSRLIRTQINDDSFTNPTKKFKSTVAPNKLNIPEFLASREFEIQALDAAMVKSQNSGASRVFQSLPRTLRRRTASHNVRRIPKRMRRKALKEMGMKTQYNGEKIMVGTSGVKPNGKPLNAKLGRGRERWKIKKDLILIKNFRKLKNGIVIDKLIDRCYGTRLNFRNTVKELKKYKKELNEPDTTNLSKFAKEETNFLYSYNRDKSRRGNYFITDETSVNKLSVISNITQIKYYKRQKNFKWLPTHVWHAKRAKMMKRWDWNIPLTPTQKCFRSTSRASRVKGTVVQDATYYNTLVINFYTDDMKNIVLDYIKRITKKKNINKYIEKCNAWSGYIYLDENADPIDKALIYISKSNLMIRMHPSSYSILFSDVLKTFDEFDEITVHDCKYSIGSISLSGPKSIDVLHSMFYRSNIEPKSDGDYSYFLQLNRLSDINIIPNGTTFSFQIGDPRKKTGEVPYKSQSHEETLDVIINLQNRTKPQKTLLDYEERINSLIELKTMKQLFKKGSNNFSDSKFSIILIKSYNNWTLLMPWAWIMPFWHELVKLPHVQIGGWKENEQMFFESGKVGWADAIFTNCGFVQSQIEKDENELKWSKRPKSKRIEFEKIKVDRLVKGEILSPFGLDFRGLQTLRYAMLRINQNNEATTKNGCDIKGNIIPQTIDDLPSLIKTIQTSETMLKEQNEHELLLKHKPITSVKHIINPQELIFNIRQLPPLTVVAVKLECVNKGHIKPNARVYQIPKEKEDIWKKVGYGEIVNIKGKPVSFGGFDGKGKCFPAFSDVIGLVSSATFNLSFGKSTGIGYLDFNICQEKKLGHVLVRNVGSTTFALMAWKRIELV